MTKMMPVLIVGLKDNNEVERMINEYAKNNNLSSEDLTFIYDRYCFAQSIDKKMMNKLIEEQNFQGGYLERLPLRKKFTSDLEGFIKRTYDEYVPRPEITKRQPIDNKALIEASKEIERVSTVNWESYKKSHPLVNSYSKEDIISTLNNKSYNQYPFKFKSFDEFIENVYYHGTKSPDMAMKEGLMPSIVFNDNMSVGGGYDTKYYGISLSEDKKICAEFTSLGDGGRIGKVFTVVISPDANVLELPNITDSADIEDNIEEFWHYGVDVIKTGNEGEKEVIILNPGTAKIVDVATINKDDWIHGNIENSSRDGLKKIYNENYEINTTAIKQVKDHENSTLNDTIKSAAERVNSYDKKQPALFQHKER